MKDRVDIQFLPLKVTEDCLIAFRTVNAEATFLHEIPQHGQLVSG